jgi:hypothetical protein
VPDAALQSALHGGSLRSCPPSGNWYVDEKAAHGIQTQDDMKNHAISAKLPEAFSSSGKTLVIQFTGMRPLWFL